MGAITLLLVLFLPLAVSAEEAQPTIEDLFLALGQQDWDKAVLIGDILDANQPSEAFFAPFAVATSLVAQGQCEQAMPLAESVVTITPDFLPAYDLIATCMQRDGKAVSAARLYRYLADQLDDGPERELLLARANAAAPDMSLKFYLDGALTPTSNANRATYESHIGNGQINPESRAKKGVQAQLSGTLEKPVYASDKLFSTVSLSLGSAYSTHDKQAFPFVRIASRTRFALSATSSVSGMAFYEYTLKGNERYFDQTGFRSDYAKAVNARFNLGIGAGITRYNYVDDARDGVGVDVSAYGSHYLGARDKVSLSTGLNVLMRQAPRHSYNEISGEVEWEHRLENGFITSLNLGGALKRYRANAVLTAERQLDKKLYGRIGLSHQKLMFKSVRPELANTATRQWSNDVFSRFGAHDVSLRIKAAF